MVLKGLVKVPCVGRPMALEVPVLAAFCSVPFTEPTLHFPSIICPRQNSSETRNLIITAVTALI